MIPLGFYLNEAEILELFCELKKTFLYICVIGRKQEKNVGMVRMSSPGCTGKVLSAAGVCKC